MCVEFFAHLLGRGDDEFVRVMRCFLLLVDSQHVRIIVVIRARDIGRGISDLQHDIYIYIYNVQDITDKHKIYQIQDITDSQHVGLIVVIRISNLQDEIYMYKDIGNKSSS